MASYYYDSTPTAASTWATWTTSTASVTATCGDTWVYWVNCSTASASTTTSTATAWYNWTQPTYTQIPAAPRFTPEELESQRQAQLEATRKAQEEASRIRAEKEQAEATANELLRELIGDEQWKVYRETGRLLVKGKEADFLIQKEGMVKKIAKDKVTDLCIHLTDRYSMPPTDNVIALRTLVAADEYEFEKVANKHKSIDRSVYVLPRAACN